MKKENRARILLRYLVVIVLMFAFAGIVAYKALDNSVLSAKQ